jgi:hypothetical protein
MGVSWSSLAIGTVMVFRAVFDELYARRLMRVNVPFGLLVSVSEPKLLDRFTMRPADDLRSSGNMALITATGPNTLVLYVRRTPLGQAHSALYHRCKHRPY